MRDPPREHKQHLDIRSVLATDCGSTTTKAIIIEKVDGVYRQTFRGEAPATVEAPFEDAEACPGGALIKKTRYSVGSRWSREWSRWGVTCPHFRLYHAPAGVSVRCMGGMNAASF